jgi:transcriptional regulator with XRE-family HTH domain
MSKSPNSVDVAVGSRVRFRRKQLGLSQGRLGEKLGITFQQIQKYEKGTNRVGASRLQAMASVLDVPVSYFFPDPGTPLDKSDAVTALLDSRGAIEMLTAFTRIEDPGVRKAILALTRALKNATTGSARTHN